MFRRFHNSFGQCHEMTTIRLVLTHTDKLQKAGGGSAPSGPRASQTRGQKEEAKGGKEDLRYPIPFRMTLVFGMASEPKNAIHTNTMVGRITIEPFYVA